MISEKMQDALNRQINAEIYSSYLYLSMSTYFESVSLRGFAKWTKVQAQEELVHAMKIFNHIVDRGGRVILTSIEAPPTGWDSALEVFENVYNHEQKVTGLIHGLVDLASSLKDHATMNFLQWFVDEQVEEEASADDVVQKVKLVGDSGAALLMLDNELGGREFNPEED